MPALPICVLALACGSSSRTVPPDAAVVDSDTDSDGDADTDLDSDADSDSESDTASDSGSDSKSCDSGGTDCDPNVFPCDRDSDCFRWWSSMAFCLDGNCCLGSDVDGECRCGEHDGTCPPLYEACCVTLESPDIEVCTTGDFCDWGY